MTKRNWIYVGLLAFISLGLLIDAAIWPAGTPSSFTANDLVQMVGILTLFSWWEIEDAAKKDIKRSSAAKVATIMLAPVGLAIYLYQTRPWKPATIGLIGFMSGLIIVGVSTLLLADWLVVQGFFPPPFLRHS